MDCGRRNSDSGSYSLTQLGAHVWMLPHQPHGCRPALGLVVGQEHALAVDGGCSPAHRQVFLKQALSRIADRPLITVLTHAHWDHVCGAADGIGRVLCTEQAGEQLSQGLPRLSAFSRDGITAEYGNASAPLPLPRADTFTGSCTLHLGGISAQIITVDCDHESGCAVVLVPEEGVAFLGDALYAAVCDDCAWYTAGRLQTLLEYLLALDAAQYVPGHGAAMTKAELRDYAAHLKQVAARAGNATSRMQLRKRLLQSGDLPDAAQQEEMMWFVRGNRNIQDSSANRMD